MTDYSKIQIAKAFQHLNPEAWRANDISTGFTSIRIKGKAWTLQHGGKNYAFKRDDDGTPLSYIDLIILGVNDKKSRVYFGDWKGEDNASGPICASIDGVVPDPGVSIQQAKSCAICVRSQWVTRPDGSRKPDCQEHKRMAVLLMPAMTKKLLGAPLREPVFLKIPPGSLKSWKIYSDELIHQGIAPGAVITRISFTPDKLFEMKFDLVQGLTDAEAPTVLPLIESSQTKMIVGGAPPIRQIAPMREKVETGLLEAFGEPESEPESEPEPEPKTKPAPVSNGNGKKRGRPPKTVTADVDVDKPTPAPVAAPEPTEPAVEQPDTAEAEVWQESDSDIDDTINRLMNNKLNNMLK